MKALVTGGAGFIGSHLVERLLTDGYAVHVIDDMSSGSHSYVHSDAALHILDIRSEKCRQLITLEKPDVVFHLAAQADVQRSLQEPGFDADVNIAGTLNVLEACRDGSVSKFIFASTCAVYGAMEKELLTEEDPAAPISYYGISKLTAESYIRTFHSLYGLPYTILRFGNVYGPRQTPKGEGGVVSVFTSRIFNGSPLRIHGDGAQTRDFVHVTDVVRANAAAVGLGHQETIHVSTGTRTSVNDLVRILLHLRGVPIPAIHTSAKIGDIRNSCLDNMKAFRLLRWKPQIELYDGLQHLLREYENNESNPKR
ncbi:NAD-dependent epimerase/dehydratase family protein [Cohnella silvisoli]|uniref:NAD-dependent epimerase/dehydratase family protein n=1 Tax=Cohnella silvisoli TaxID=2873699 RepID=A0ABV1L1X4_9BACL|nr:NAD-dependent epimerase/dehydratase family protein [Cohnella silvisoli]MCD9026469.1 NAD-dependent epimerase/dehydratase family protein [Cohnella silvisoli]